MVLRGFLEGLRPFQVSGWIVDDDAPAARLSVRVCVDGRTVGSGVANLFRQDLANSAVGDGRHGFTVNVSQALPLDRPEAIVVEALEQNGDSRRVPTLSTVAVQTVDVRTQEEPPENSVKGFHFIEAPDRVVGWTFDSARPDDYLRVILESGGRHIGETTANHFQNHLLLAGVGAGDHGFQINAPHAAIPLMADNTAVFAVSVDGVRTQLGVAVRQQANAPEAAPGAPLFPSDIVDAAQFPVIILGAARSGTSAMAQALLGSRIYQGYGEGHFLDVIQPLLQATQNFYRSRAEDWRERSTLLSQVPQRFIEEGQRHILIEAIRHVFPGGKWIDKTPRASTIAVAPLLRDIWPNARFVFMRRRAIENLTSRLRKFPNLDFAGHCREWALTIQSWYAVAGNLRGAAIEIDQMHMARHPHEVAAALAKFLDLPYDASERVAQALAFDQPERTQSHFGEAVKLAELGWPEHQLLTFRTICGDAMRQAGYAEGTGYYADLNATRAIVNW